MELRLRHRCRNPRCGTTLKEPQENPHAAFCCRGCFEQYHRRRCVVCEREYARRGGEREQWRCERSKCRRDYEKFPAFYRPFHLGSLCRVPNAGATGVESRIKRALKPASKSLRAFVWRARDEKELTWELLRLSEAGDFDPGPAALVQRRGEGWRMTYPRAIPEPPVEDFEWAKHRAETVMLWALPNPRRG